MSKQTDTDANWQAFGLQIIQMAELAVNRPLGSFAFSDTKLNRTGAEAILQLAATLRLIEREEMEMPAHTGAWR